MLRVRGNIWEEQRRRAGSLVVVPTNIGWAGEDGHNVMGAGIALQAKRKLPLLPSWYGHFCKKHGENTPVAQYMTLLLFPVKPLNKGKPWLSWRSPADLELIARSAEQLAAYRLDGLYNSEGTAPQVLLPLVGCGNGGLDPVDVLPRLDRYLTEERFVLVIRPEETKL